MQMVIIAGGLATRLRPRTLKIPKSMIEVAGKPFLQHQLALLKSHNITDIILCVGHLSEQIKAYFGDGSDFGVHLTYSNEGEKKLGTGGALKLAEPLLDEQFFVMWGDSYLRIDYKDVWDSFDAQTYDVLMVVYRNNNVGDTSNVLFQDNRVIIYDKWNPHPEMQHIDYGLSIFKKAALKDILAGEPFALERTFQKLSKQQRLAAYQARHCFHEIGSFDGIKKFEQFLGE